MTDKTKAQNTLKPGELPAEGGEYIREPKPRPETPQKASQGKTKRGEK